MIVLTATPDLRATFEKLIANMEAPVKWNGLFVVIDNCLILQGEVRSLFFHFDKQKVFTNVIDLEIKAQNIWTIGDNYQVKNVLNMLLYAFGKWGTLKGLKVEKDEEQLRILFANILKDLKIEPDYAKDRFQFYKDGMRMVYEDVVLCAYEYKEEELAIEGENQAGLWHKLIWIKRMEQFDMVEVNELEKKENRMGNNFYLTQYICPVCNEKMFRVVYPDTKEFIIDTNEGRVRMVRAFTCKNCCSFYTARPRRLLVEGDCYVMDFEKDNHAYEDYLELLGKNGDRISNYHFNEYVDASMEEKTMEEKAVEEKVPGEALGTEKEVPSLEETMKILPTLPDLEMKRFISRSIEGFYPEELVEKVEKQIWKEYKKRAAFNHTDRMEKYKARLKQYPRLSQRQRTEFLKQVKEDRQLNEEQRAELREQFARQKTEEEIRQIREKIAYAKRKNRRVLYRVFEEINAASLEEAKKETLRKETGVSLEEYQEFLLKKEEQETVEKNSSVERLEKRARETEPSIKKDSIKEDSMKEPSIKVDSIKEEHSREEQKQPKRVSLAKVDFGKPTEDIRKIKRKLEKISHKDRAAFVEILEELQSGVYDKKEAAPYVEDVEQLILKLDEDYLDQLMGNLLQMSFEEANEALKELEEATILPKLKMDAIAQLEKRLSKIKLEECELLIQKWNLQWQEAKLGEYERHHFYPAKAVLQREPCEEELDLISYAMASYGAGLGRFEYPIWLADTSHGKKGDRGMFLTPENLFYSTMTTSYHIPIMQIASIEAATGLFHKGLFAVLTNGEKIKIPYVVDGEQLPALAAVCDSFIKYLQEKPFSRKEAYLVKDSHEKICCFRCGYVYQGKKACPKCGYKTNK